MRRPFSGRSFAKRARIARTTGMCRSAHSMRCLPSRASFMSLTWPATAAPLVAAPLLRREVLRAIERSSREGELSCESECSAIARTRLCRSARGASTRKMHWTGSCGGTYAFAYETDHIDSRLRNLRRPEAARRGAGPHVHRGGRARAAPRHPGPGQRAPRAGAAPLLRSRAVPGGPVRPRRPRHAVGARAGVAVIALDTSVLAFGVNRYAPEHRRAVELVEDLVNGDAAWDLPWTVVYELLKLVSHPHAVARPLKTSDAWAFLGQVVASPSVHMLAPTERHGDALVEVLPSMGAESGVPAGLGTAVLLREHGVRELLSAARSMRRYSSLAVRDPLRGEPWVPQAPPLRRYRMLRARTAES